LREQSLSGIPDLTVSAKARDMTNLIAISLGGIILVALGLDIIFNDGTAVLFVGRKLIDFIEYLAFWR
jgi:hypothetical protein